MLVIRSLIMTAAIINGQPIKDCNFAVPKCNCGVSRKYDSIFSNTQHYAVCVRTIASCMPSHHLRRLDAPLTIHSTKLETKLQ